MPHEYIFIVLSLRTCARRWLLFFLFFFAACVTTIVWSPWNRSVGGIASVASTVSGLDSSGGDGRDR